MERLAAQPQCIEQDFNRERRAYNDVTTWLAEAMDGSMRTPFEYRFDGHELYAEDGEALSRFFEKGITDAHEIARLRPNLAFELRRRKLELDEYHDMLKMVRGELPNVMVAISDFPPELMDAATDVGGYNVARKQTMLRVIIASSGRLKMYSQSLDGSNRRALEAMYARLGCQAKPGELLGQRIHKHVDGTAAEFMVDELTGVYDRSMAAQTGMHHKSGQRLPVGRQQIETYQFACSQTDLVRRAVTQVLQGRFDTQAMYEVAATINNRYDLACQGLFARPQIMRSSQFDPILARLLNQEIQSAASDARSLGKVFSGCGATVSPAQQLTAAEQLQATSFGNKTTKETKYNFDKKMYCVDCQAPPKEKAPKKKMCGPCGLCRDCDAKRGGQGWA